MCVRREEYKLWKKDKFEKDQENLNDRDRKQDVTTNFKTPEKMQNPHLLCRIALELKSLKLRTSDSEASFVQCHGDH